MHLGRAFAILLSASPLFAQYAGPAILSRGEAPASMGGPQISFRPFIDITGVYDTGLAGVSVNAAGDIANTAAYGMELAWGVSGSHGWRHTRVGLDYRGDLRHYTKVTYYDTTDQSLLLGVTHQFSRHTGITLRETGGLYSQPYGVIGLVPTVPYDPASAYIPNTDFFDNRTMYLSTQADFVWQKSARLSFDFGGDGFLNRRRSSALYGVTGSSARGDLEYRLSRRTTIGVNYMYSHYSFTGVFSSTDMHGLAAAYAVRLSRNLEFSAYGGALRMETKFVQNVPVDPAVTALIGITESTAVIYSRTYVPNYSGRLSRTFARGVAYFSGGQTVTPGNGLFLTSRMTGISGGYTYTGLRRWSFNSNIGYNGGRSVGNVVGHYSNTVASMSMSRQIGRSVHAILSFAANNYGSNDFSKYNRLVYNARIGLGFSPGDVPLRIW